MSGASGAGFGAEIPFANPGDYCSAGPPIKWRPDQKCTHFSISLHFIPLQTHLYMIMVDLGSGGVRLADEGLISLNKSVPLMYHIISPGLSLLSLSLFFFLYCEIENCAEKDGMTLSTAVCMFVCVCVSRCPMSPGGGFQHWLACRARDSSLRNKARIILHANGASSPLLHLSHHPPSSSLAPGMLEVYPCVFAVMFRIRQPGIVTLKRKEDKEREEEEMEEEENLRSHVG